MTTISPLLPSFAGLAQKRPEMGPRPAAAPDLAESWAATARSLRADAVARRLEVVEKVLEVLRPMVAAMIRTGGGGLARPLAGTVEGLARSLAGAAQEFEGAVAQARAPATSPTPPAPHDDHAAALRHLGGRLRATISRTADFTMWIHAAASASGGPSFGRQSARQATESAAGFLIEANNRTTAALARLPAAPANSRLSLRV